jgi:hypothetical protein
MVPYRQAPLVFFLFFWSLLLPGCKSLDGPSIEFTRIPPAAEGGQDRLAIIEGRVDGARKGQQIVLYAKSGVWWVQPFTAQEFTPVGPDSKWSSSTHLGSEYAALLVNPGYRPALTMPSLPPQGAGVVLVATVKGVPTASEFPKTVHFSGYEWNVRATASERGGRVCNNDPANAWTDPSGALHLRIVNSTGKWTCAEVSLTRSLGYGSYRFVVRETSHLEPAVVLDLFTWDDSGSEQNHRELDIEMARWGDPNSKNAQYVVQPYYVAPNVARFSAPAGALTHSFRWEPGKVSFRTIQGASTTMEGRAVAEHVFTSGVPLPGNELIHLGLYLFVNSADPIPNQTEVVIDKFEYLP